MQLTPLEISSTKKDAGHKFYYLDGGSATELSAVSCYDEFTTAGWEEITVATAIEDVTTTKYFNYLVEVDGNGKILRRGSIKTA